jgi:hypothetical protein
MNAFDDKSRTTSHGPARSPSKDQTAESSGQYGRRAEDLRALPKRSTQQLKQTWQTLLGTQPPAKLSRDLLIRVIADKMQEATLGGLAPEVKRKLATLARQAESSAGTQPAHPMFLKPGTKLVRAWRGKTHTVLVLDNGFEHEGRRYTSLTQIADEVTGAHWSGPRFFGLNKPRPPLQPPLPKGKVRHGA